MRPAHEVVGLHATVYPLLYGSSGCNDLVFANEVGQPLDGSALLRRSFYPLLERSDLPRIRFHDLRHTAATLLMGQGVHPKLVSAMLGH